MKRKISLLSSREMGGIFSKKILYSMMKKYDNLRYIVKMEV